MSLSTELTRMAHNVGALNADTNAIFEALRAKGVDVPANAQLSDVADMIESIVPPHQNEVEIGGRWYPYVQIGNQLWLAENLDYAWSGLPINQSTTNSPRAAYYNFGNAATYGVDGTYKCGLMYNWYAVNYLEQNKSSLLPSGWRVPGISDVNSMKTSINSDTSKIKAKDGDVIAGTWPRGWNGTNETGVSIIPSGTHNGQFWGLGIVIWIWSKDEVTSSNADAYSAGTSSSFATGNGSKQFFNYLRLVKDT